MDEKRHTSSHYEKELQEIKDGLIFIWALDRKGNYIGDEVFI